jgi:hypothetical protein
VLVFGISSRLHGLPRSVPGYAGCAQLWARAAQVKRDGGARADPYLQKILNAQREKQAGFPDFYIESGTTASHKRVSLK